MKMSLYFTQNGVKFVPPVCRFLPQGENIDALVSNELSKLTYSGIHISAQETGNVLLSKILFLHPHMGENPQTLRDINRRVSSTWEMCLHLAGCRSDNLFLSPLPLFKGMSVFRNFSVLKVKLLMKLFMY